MWCSNDLRPLHKKGYHPYETSPAKSSQRPPAFTPRRQRMFLIAAGIALQFAIYVVLLVLFSQYFVYFYWICVLVSLVMALFISTWKSKLAYKIAWIIPILLVPLIGGVMFIILGGAATPLPREETRRTLKRQLPSGCPPRT